MKLLQLLITAFLFSITGHAQTYAPYTGNKANATTVSKPAAAKSTKPKPLTAEKAPVKETEKSKEDDFQTLMNKAVEQLHQKDYQMAESFYTQALGVSTKKTAWRALLSRATLYSIIKDDDKALADLTKAIETKGTPEKQLAIIYVSRARLHANHKNMDLACADVAKAKAIGLPDALTVDFECK
ncbi:tetratricopeptide repeat protein [Flavobacterium hauense]